MAKGLTAAELRISDEEELRTKLSEAKEELFNLRFQGATGQLESHGRLRAVRKEIARIYTVMRERELGIVTEVEEVPGYGEAGSVPAGQAAAEATAAPAAEEAVAEEAAAGTEGPEAAGAAAEAEAPGATKTESSGGQEADESE
jgi:large subunit ribosomal protein L29